MRRTGLPSRARPGAAWVQLQRVPCAVARAGVRGASLGGTCLARWPEAAVRRGRGTSPARRSPCSGGASAPGAPAEGAVRPARRTHGAARSLLPPPPPLGPPAGEGLPATATAASCFPHAFAAAPPWPRAPRVPPPAQRLPAPQPRPAAAPLARVRSRSPRPTLPLLAPAMLSFQYPDVYRDETAVSTNCPRPSASPPSVRRRPQPAAPGPAARRPPRPASLPSPSAFVCEKRAGGAGSSQAAEPPGRGGHSPPAGGAAWDGPLLGDFLKSMGSRADAQGGGGITAFGLEKLLRKYGGRRRSVSVQMM